MISGLDTTQSYLINESKGYDCKLCTKYFFTFYFLHILDIMVRKITFTELLVQKTSRTKSKLDKTDLSHLLDAKIAPLMDKYISNLNFK